MQNVVGQGARFVPDLARAVTRRGRYCLPLTLWNPFDIFGLTGCDTGKCAANGRKSWAVRSATEKAAQFARINAPEVRKRASDADPLAPAAPVLL